MVFRSVLACAWMVSERFQGDSKVSAVRALSLENKWVSMGFDGFDRLLWVTMDFDGLL